MSVTIEDIEALRRVLTELPRHQPQEVSKQEAIALLSSELGAARRRGYTPDELARVLSERGVAINAATLRGYLRRNRKSRKANDGKAPIEPRSPEASPSRVARVETGAQTTALVSAPPLPPPRSNAAGAIPGARVATGSAAAPAHDSRPTGQSATDGVQGPRK